MSEPLNEMNDLTLPLLADRIDLSRSLKHDHVHHLDLDLELDFDLDSDLGQCGARIEGDPAQDNLHALPVRVQTLTNSPGCRPASDSPPTRSTAHSPTHSPGQPTQKTFEPRTGTPSASNPGPRPLRRARRVSVDAWAVPAAANWGRGHRAMRKVARVSRSTDWALPF